MQFGDHSILYMLNETDDGRRVLEEAIRIWNDGRARARVARTARVRAHAHARHAHDRAVDDRLPRRAGRRLLGDRDAARHRVHRDRHRLRHGGGLAPRDAPGSARRAGTHEERRARSRASASTASSTTSRASRAAPGRSATDSTSTASGARSRSTGCTTPTPARRNPRGRRAAWRRREPRCAPRRQRKIASPSLEAGTRIESNRDFRCVASVSRRVPARRDARPVRTCSTRARAFRTRPPRRSRPPRRRR